MMSGGETTLNCLVCCLAAYPVKISYVALDKLLALPGALNLYSGDYALFKWKAFLIPMS